MKILLVSPLPPPEGGIATWTIGFSEYCKVLTVKNERDYPLASKKLAILCIF